MPLIISTPRSSVSLQEVTLENKNIAIDLSWNNRNSSWYIGLYDIFENPILTGIRLVPDTAINLRYTDDRLPDGIISLVQLSDRVTLGRFNLGTDFKLCYFTQDELDNVFIQ